MDRDYDPNDAANRAAAIRQQKYEEVKALLLEQGDLLEEEHETLLLEHREEMQYHEQRLDLQEKILFDFLR